MKQKIQEVILGTLVRLCRGACQLIKPAILILKKNIKKNERRTRILTQQQELDGETDELRSALELATEAELRELTEILFRPKYNPIDYLMPQVPVEFTDRSEWITELENRFRFLAADGLTVLQRKTHRISYRQTLLQVCRHLKLPYQGRLRTADLEAEIFLHLLSRAWKSLPTDQKTTLTKRVEQSLTHTKLWRDLPNTLQRDPMSLMLKGGSAIAVSSVIKPLLLQLIARQFALHYARLQVTESALVAGSLIQKHFTAKLAQQGMALATARYGATRSIFAVLGPAMWTWFLADLGWRSISTNYARIIPSIFAIAQIRLLRGLDEPELLEAYP
jgi:uncharacterized protein YaaW (UPF0174 family)